MKKLILLTALLFAFIINAQDYPGKRPELLIGKEVKVKDIEIAQQFGYTGFYNSEVLDEAYPNGGIHTKKELLLGKIFKVIDIKRGNCRLGGICFVIKLELDNKYLYYQYDPTLISFYPFEVIGGLELPKDVYCDLLRVANLSKGTTYETKKVEGIDITKSIWDGKTKYSMFVNIFGNIRVSNPKGVIIILEGDKKIVKPSNIVGMEYHDGKSYRYTSSVELTLQEIELLKTNKIIGVSLDSIGSEIQMGDVIKGMVYCL